MGGAPEPTLALAGGDFSHRAHAGGGLQCAACHTPPGMSAREVRCQSCHEQHHVPERACLSCHREGALDKHTRIVHVACVECHESTPALNRWSRQICTTCHTRQATGHYVARPCEACHQVPAMGKGPE